MVGTAGGETITVIAGHWEEKSLPEAIKGIWRHKTGGFGYDILDWFSRGVLNPGYVAAAREYYDANVTELLKEVRPTPEQSAAALRAAGKPVPARLPPVPGASKHVGLQAEVRARIAIPAGAASGRIGIDVLARAGSSPEQSAAALRAAGKPVPAPEPEPQGKPKKVAREYKCSVCGQPKKGHVCPGPPRGEKKPTAKWVDNPELAKRPFNPELCNCRKWNGGYGAQCNRVKLADDDLCALHKKNLERVIENGGEDLSHGRFNGVRPTHCLAKPDKEHEHPWKDLTGERAAKRRSAKTQKAKLQEELSSAPAWVPTLFFIVSVWWFSDNMQIPVYLP